MDLSLQTFITNIVTNPFFLLCSLLTLAVNTLNGKTLAPNSVATSISTRAVTPRTGVFIVVTGNFLGLLIMTLVNASVANAMFGIADFGNDPHNALIALSGGLIAFTVWQFISTHFGIPSSGSHALISSLSGAAIASMGSFSALNGKEWIKVFIGLVTSPLLGFTFGLVFAKFLRFMFRNSNRIIANKFFKWAQISGSFANAFMNGAHDGQKFLGVFLIGMSLVQGGGKASAIPIWLIILCALAMSFGASMCSIKTVKAVGMDMVKLEVYQGFASDFATVSCILIASLTGIPVSATHTKTCSILGVGAAKRFSAVKWTAIKTMVTGWVLTFPVCGTIGYLAAKGLLLIFGI